MNRSTVFVAAAIFTLGGCIVALEDYDQYKLRETVIDELPPTCPAKCYGDGTPSVLQDVGACKSGTPVCEGSQVVSCDGWVAPSLELCNAGSGSDADEDCSSKACDNVFEWSGRIGDTMNIETLNGLAMGADGSVVLTGKFTGTFGLGGGLPNITDTNATVVAKYKSDGTPAWMANIKYKDQNPIAVRDIAVDGNNRIYFAGQYNFQNTGALYGYLGTLTPEGVLGASSLQLGAAPTGAGDMNAIAVDVIGGVYVAGTITGSAPVLCANPAMVHTAGANPNMVVVRTKGTTGSDCIYGKVFPGGKQIPTAMTVGTVAGKETLVVIGTYEGSFSTLPLAPVGQAYGFVMQLDAFTGTESWQMAFVANAAQSRVEVNNVAIDSTGRIFVTGAIYGEVVVDGQSFTGDAAGDMFIASFQPANPSMKLTGFRLVKGAGVQKGVDVAIQGDKVFVSGYFDGGIDLADMTKLPAKIPSDVQGPFWLQLDPMTLDAYWIHTLGVVDANGGANPADSLRLALSPTSASQMAIAGTAKRNIMLSNVFDGTSVDIFVGVLNR
jgi:hypothetical protein